MEAIHFLKNKGITKATCYTDRGTYYVSELAKLMEEYAALRQPPVSGMLPSVDPLDDENSEIHKIGKEIAEMLDEEFEANCKALEKMLKGSKGNDR